VTSPSELAGALDAGRTLLERIEAPTELVQPSGSAA